MSEKAVFRTVLAVSIVVFLLVVILNRRWLPVPETFPSFIYFLPTLNALINGSCFVLLLLSLRAIKAKKIDLHKKINLITFGLSALFLISYVTYHYFVPETTYGGSGWMATAYYIILISHIILAALVLPLILLSFYFALTQQVARHKKWVRWTYPIWLFVTFSGVAVYLMISPYYQFPV